MLVANFFHAWIRQPDGIDHPALALRDPRRSRSVAPLDAHRLGDESAEFVDVHYVRQLAAVSGCPSGKQNRILEIDPRGVDCERGRRHRYRWPPTRDS